MEGPSAETERSYGHRINPLGSSTGDKSQSNQPSQRSLRHGAAQPIDLPKSSKKRGGYVAKACVSCQKRKVKCSGESLCSQCHSVGEVCTYEKGPRRPRSTRVRRNDFSNLPVKRPRGKAADITPELPTTLKLLEARIAGLERDREIVGTRSPRLACQTTKNQPDKTCLSPTSVNGASGTTSRAMSLVPPDEFPGPTSLHEPIKVLQQSISEVNVSSAKELVHGEGTPLAWWYMRCGHRLDIKLLEKDFLNNSTRYNESLDTFFTHINPLYPCLNEKWFRMQLELVRCGDTGYGHADRAQFIALTNLMYSEVQILVRDSTVSDRVPALLEFSHADQILSNLTWLGSGNMLTIHCLLVKSRYLLYIERCASAYETMGRVVHLCYRLGLNNQDLWERASPFDKVMRQRLFWTIFFLERKIALLAGAPYLIRHSDIKVDLPPALDEELIVPDQPLPDESPLNTPVPYLITAVKWGRLCSDIWDAMFGVNAQKSASPEFVAATDALILYAINQMPEHLRWSNVGHHLKVTDKVKPLIARQSFTLHLLLNRLRLLLRQEFLLNIACVEDQTLQCTKLTTGLVDVMYDWKLSKMQHPTDRYNLVLQLIGAVLYLTCIIFKPVDAAGPPYEAFEAFEKALYLWDEFTPTFRMACHGRNRLQRIIAAALKRIATQRAVDDGRISRSPLTPESLTTKLNGFMSNGLLFSAAEDTLDEPLNFPDPVMMDASMTDLATFDLRSYGHDFDLSWLCENEGAI